jgi:general secretion pathway protein J
VKRQSTGFTLVELLLATALLSILLGLIYGGLRSSIRATDRGQIILEESSRLRMAHQFVHKQLSQMMPLGFAQSETDDSGFAQSETDDSFTVFQGSSDSIRFVAPMPGYLGFGGPQVQELSLVSNRSGNGLALVLNHAVLQDFEESKLYEREEIFLLGGIEEGEFLFQGKEEGELTGWMPDWEFESELPRAVSLSISFENESHVIWPLLSAFVRIDSMSVRLAGGRKAAYSAGIQKLVDEKGEQN